MMNTTNPTLIEGLQREKQKLIQRLDAVNTLLNIYQPKLEPAPHFETIPSPFKPGERVTYHGDRSEYIQKGYTYIIRKVNRTGIYSSGWSIAVKDKFGTLRWYSPKYFKRYQDEKAH